MHICSGGMSRYQHFGEKCVRRLLPSSVITQSYHLSFVSVGSARNKTMLNWFVHLYILQKRVSSSFDSIRAPDCDQMGKIWDSVGTFDSHLHVWPVNQLFFTMWNLSVNLPVQVDNACYKGMMRPNIVWRGIGVSWAFLSLTGSRTDDVSRVALPLTVAKRKSDAYFLNINI